MLQTCWRAFVLPYFFPQDWGRTFFWILVKFVPEFCSIRGGQLWTIWNLLFCSFARQSTYKIAAFSTMKNTNHHYKYRCSFYLFIYYQYSARWRPWVPHSFLNCKYPVSLPAGKAAGCDVKYPLHIVPGLKKEWSYTAAPRLGIHGLF
jgi:hypothetical protein